MFKKKLIHQPYNKFKGFLREKGLTYKDVEGILNLSPSAVGLKINGFSDFYLIQHMKKALNVSDDFFL